MKRLSRWPPDNAYDGVGLESTVRILRFTQLKADLGLIFSIRSAEGQNTSALQPMDYPPFEIAVARFRSFLNDLGHRGPIAWVSPSDALLVSNGWLIRPRAQDMVQHDVMAVYETGIERRLGVKFGVLCFEGTIAWCYIYVPSDQTEAEYGMMPDGLKLSVPTAPLQCRRVTDESEWERLQPHDMVEPKRSMFM